MAKKKVNRKKQLRKQLAALKKAGKQLAGATVEKTQEVVEQVVETTSHVVEKVKDKAQDVVETVTKKADESKNQAKKAAASFEDFTEELAGVAPARLETFYQEGIKSIKDFAKWTEKELLALKGIGPATIKQLKELGVKLKG